MSVGLTLHMVVAYGVIGDYRVLQRSEIPLEQIVIRAIPGMFGTIPLEGVHLLLHSIIADRSVRRVV